MATTLMTEEELNQLPDITVEEFLRDKRDQLCKKIKVSGMCVGWWWIV